MLTRVSAVVRSVPTQVFLPVLFLVLANGSPIISQTVSAPFAPVTDQMLQHPNPADWLSWRSTPNGWGYSPLKQIKRSNVAQLRLAWSRALGNGVQATAPLVYAGVMYITSPNDWIQAIDVKTGDIKWQYRRSLPRDLNDHFPIPHGRKRNIAIYGDTIISAGSDSVLYALNVETGKLVWETKIEDYKTGVAQTSGPIMAGGRVISGRSCSPWASYETCAITAHDAKTGKELWRTQTVPRPGEPGDESWGGLPMDKRRHVGAWMPATYDPELDLIFIGTSVTSPAPKFMLAGNDKKHLYHNCTLAIDAKTGNVKWYYQHLVDHWDLDHAFERILVDSQVTPDAKDVPWRNPRLKMGQRRSVVTGIPGKTGLVYTLDRRTGEFLWARPTIHQNVISAIDGANGAVTENPAMLFDQIGEERLVCPSSDGGKDWQAGAYDPTTNVMFQPMQNTCMKTTPIKEEKPFYSIKREHQMAPGVTKLGTIYAVSVETGRIVWKFENKWATSSLVSTGGGVLFGGDVDGRLRAFDQRTGRVLWEIGLGSPISGFPIVFAADGKEYVAVTTGVTNHTVSYARIAGQLAIPVANNIFVFSLPNK